MIIRDETRADAPAVRAINETAFGRPAEADLVAALVDAGAAICSLVAEEAGDVIGHALFTPATLSSGGKTKEIAALGPLAVHPAWQKRGVGGQLIESGLQRCRAAGYDLIIVLGHPGYYPRFGFRPSAPFGIRWERDVPEDVFMVAELAPGALAGASGIVRYRPEFDGV